MAASRQVIQWWFEQGVRQQATHLIVVTDSVDFEDAPVYVGASEDVRKREAEYRQQGLAIMEVYNLRMPMEPQLNERRAFNY
jgi:hypothetical protein